MRARRHTARDTLTWPVVRARRALLVDRAAAALLVGLVACLACLSLSTAPAFGSAAAVSPWASVQSPAGAAWTAHDAFAFGSTSLALAGDGHIAVTRDAGHTWKVVVPRGHGGTAFTAVAFNTSGRGVVASGGLLLVTADWGATWAPPAYVGAAPSAAVTDVAMRSKRVVAVGEAGMILTSTDSGATWQTQTSPTTSMLTSVALAGDGTAVAGSDAGEILVGRTAWTVAGAAAAPVTGVTAAASPVWGDGAPDLFAATGHDVLGSDDALTFASLPGLPDLSADVWPAVTWTGRPERALLLAGAQQAGFFGSSKSWVSAATGLDGLVAAVAPGEQSVAYLLDAGGRLSRTLGAGRDPSTVTLTRSSVVAGSRTRLTATIHVAAPGAILLRTRVPGRPWTTLRRVPWTDADWDRRLSFDLAPSLTHDYALEFQYGGTTTPLAPVTQVIAVPRITTARLRYDLRRGAVFRFSGSVAPQLRGERVELLTDRGGGWRPVSLQRSVALRNGRTWMSRKFGTPNAETYRLRAHLPRTRTHAEAWSRIVTVTIR